MAGPKYDPFTRRTYGISLRSWRPYNRALNDWLSGISKERDGAVIGTIPVIYATPERAFARRESPLNEGRPDIPLISYYMSSVDADFDRVNGILPSHYPFETVPVPGTNRMRRIPKMLPFNISYMATLWAKHIYQVQIADFDLLSRMRPHSYIHVYGADCPLYFESASDSSDLEPGSGGDRQIRRDYSFRVEGWLPLPYIESDRLEKITIGLTDDPAAGEGPDGSEDGFPEWEIPENAIGGVLVTNQMLPTTGAAGVGDVPNVDTREAERPFYSTSSLVGRDTIGGASIDAGGAIRMPDGTAIHDRGRVAFRFSETNEPTWNPTPGAPVLIWQPRDNINPNVRYGSAYLYRKIQVVGGYEFHGVVPTGRFVEPARLTSDGVTLYDAERVETLI